MNDSTLFDRVEPDNSSTTGLKLFNLVRERMGWTDEYLKEVNDPTHPLLKDIDTMCAALEYLRVNNMPLVVVPDFDTDGICAGTILYAGLSELGLDVRLHVPDYHLGHEIQPRVIDRVMLAFPDAKALITCDAGTNSTGALSRANEYELLTLVTDHHVEETCEPQNHTDFGLSNRCSIVDNCSVRTTWKGEEKWHRRSTLQSLSACSIMHLLARSTSCDSTSTACPISSWRMCSRYVTRTSLLRRARSASQRGESRSIALRRRLEKRAAPSLRRNSKSKAKARVRRWNCENQIELRNELPVTITVTGSSVFLVHSSIVSSSSPMSSGMTMPRILCRYRSSALSTCCCGGVVSEGTGLLEPLPGKPSTGVLPVSTS